MRIRSAIVLLVSLCTSHVPGGEAASAQQDVERRLRVLMIEENLTEREALARVAAESGLPRDSVAEEDEYQIGRPDSAFTGCETAIAKAPELVNSRDRIEDAVVRVDALTNREFVSISVNKLAESLTAAELDTCWFRLDGVWREDQTVALDTNFIPEGWSSTRPELVHLANGTYTTPMHIYVLPSRNPANFLNIHPVSSTGPPILYASNDGISLQQLLEDRGRRKVYMADRPTPGPGLAQRMTVDVTRTGYLRLRIGATTFLRPAPGTVSKVQGDDPFMIGYTMENLRASRTGYNVAEQNPNRLLQNSMAEVFDFASNRGAVIDQRRVVPLGLRLIKEETQGNVYYSRSVSSEREFQEMTKSSFGNSTRIGLSGNVGSPGRDGGPSTSVNIDASIGWGSANARQQFLSLRSSNSVAEETGYMRFKKLALVLEPAYVRLTDRFVDAVADAQHYRNFNELIQKFGTHYPYAITYGAAGQVSQKITATAFEKRRQNSTSSNSSANVAFVVGSTSSYKSSEGQSGTSFKEENQYGERTFDAVGGNGSWDQNGFSAGDAHYPILADLRPLSELLNPINFPDQPEIYIDLRQQLDQAIGEYLVVRATLSEESLIPATPVRPEPKSELRLITVTTWQGSKESIRVSSQPGGVKPGFVRVCLKNNKRGVRTLIHRVPRINNLESAGSGAESCANFPANMTLNLSANAAGRPATLSNATGIRLAPFAGSRLYFIWR
jgi:hypothetical protein